jgi:hypothetical protein
LEDRSTGLEIHLHQIVVESHLLGGGVVPRRGQRDSLGQDVPGFKAWIYGAQEYHALDQQRRPGEQNP